MDTPQDPERRLFIAPSVEHGADIEESETVPYSIVAALALSMWGHPGRTPAEALSLAAEGSIGKHPYQNDLDELITVAIENGYSLSSDDRMNEKFDEAEKIVAGDAEKEIAVAHVKIVYSTSQSDTHPEHRQHQALVCLYKIFIAGEPPKPDLRPLN